MTSDQQAFLDTIRTIVSGAVAEGIAPLAMQVDALSTRVDALAGQVDGLNTRVDALAGQVDGLNTRVDALAGQVDGLSTRVDALSTRMDGLVAHVGELTERVDGLDQRTIVLEERVETIDMRTSQMASDLLYLRDRVPLLEERIDNGFRSLKSDLGLAFSDIRNLTTSQSHYERMVGVLRQELASLQQRLAALEAGREAAQP
jgi:outer membrane murein-binding lipoprotein Lpp